MIQRTYAEDILTKISTCDDACIDLGEGALALAALDRPEVSPDPYRDHMAKLADDVGDSLAAGSNLSHALNGVLLRAYGYHGDRITYDDIRNANIMDVIDRKKGLPVTLGILFITVARAHGIVAEGLNFPGHFLIRLGGGRDRIILDPFNDGIERTSADLRELIKVTCGLEAELMPAHYKAVGNRDILIRLQNNIKTRHEQAGRIEKVLQVIDGMLKFAPSALFLWREAGIVHARMGNFGAAIEAFTVIVDRAESAAVRHDALSIIQKLKCRNH
ncbi:MAG: hypothetical protein CFH41_01104 [Alphaproteobacteria bacterium MarineAlpha11_Bin1]|nr:MAG: hypothetical protein CFH41_01104 [Alphaproteobacteria bacterium MarineAlpha11_Bin1]